jgi:hypothetical protein
MTTRHKRSFIGYNVMGIFQGYKLKPLCKDKPAIKLYQYWDIFAYTPPESQCKKCLFEIRKRGLIVALKNKWSNGRNLFRTPIMIKDKELILDIKNDNWIINTVSRY